eukprot:s2092_g7.t1
MSSGGKSDDFLDRHADVVHADPSEHANRLSGSFLLVDSSLKGGADVYPELSETWRDGGLSYDSISQFSDTPQLNHDAIEQFTATAETVLDNSLECDAGVSEDAALDISNFGNLMEPSHMTGIDDDSNLSARPVHEDGFMSVSADDSGTRYVKADVFEHGHMPDHVAVQAALSQSLASDKPAFMWEQDSFLSTVFGTGNIVDDLFPQVSLKRPPTALIDLTGESEIEPPIKKALRAGCKEPIFLKAISQTAVLHEETQRRNFINGWTSIVLMNVHAFTAFDKARLECDDSELREVVNVTLTECLAVKATSTVGKRLGSLRRFAEYCTSHAFSPFPLNDHSMHSYLAHLAADPKASASCGKTFLEAVRFSSAMLGLISEDETLVSKRVEGLAEMLVKRAPVIAQAIPLTVAQVKHLEKECCEAESLQDRMICGGILIMIYGAARASDMARAIKLVIDRDTREPGDKPEAEPAGYIELGVLQNKGARSDRLKRLLLPVVAPMLSLSNLPWWDCFMQARDCLSIGGEGRLDVPVLCRFNAEGEALDQAMSATEIGAFLRLILRIPEAPRNEVRSHSCKASVLSWMSKFGVPLHLRRLIGHHIDPAARSTETYSRDCLAPGLRAESEVITAIAQGRFAPDLTRSGRFILPPRVSQDDGDEADSEKSYEFPFSDNEDFTDSSSDDAASEEVAESIDDSTTLWELLRPELRSKLVRIDTKLECFVHAVSCVVHLKKHEGQRFLCGRVHNSRYERRSHGASEECPQCTTCFASKDAHPAD